MKPRSREKIDRDLLHEFLWKKTDQSGRLRVNQTHLAADLGLDRTTIVRIIKEMELAGRLQKIGEGYRRSSLYKIVDPATWKWRNEV